MRTLLKSQACILILALTFLLNSSNANAATLNLPTGCSEGINYIDDNTVVLVLLAPNKTSAEVTGSFNSWALSEMHQTPDGEHFWIQINNLVAGREYIYQYLVDGTIRISDPFAEKILDPYNDPEIPEANYPGLIEWTEKDKGLASVFQTAQPEYQWQVTDFDAPLQHHLIAYELLIRDFTEERSFQSVIDSIQYLKNLGINAIELLPVNEFDANLSWGYNPSHYFAVDKFYGPKDKLKELIDVAHLNGMAVIIDMVYNHTMNQSPLASLYWNSVINQPSADNPWYNETAPHESVGWGNDFNHESQYTQDFFDKVNKFWLEEYNIDGFRYDFTKGLTQKATTTDSEMGEYDQSRIDVITRMANKVWEVKDDAYIILEHWGNDTEENALTSYGNGMLTWRKLHHTYTEALKGNDLENQSFGGAQADNRMVFMESHDEERIPYDVANHHGSETTMMDRMELGAAFFYTVPGPKMIWMFEEQACNYSLYTCEDGSVTYTDDCKLSTKPFNWSTYMQDANRVDVYNTIANLLKLRTENEVFTLGNYQIDENGNGIENDGLGSLRQIRIEHESMDVVIIGNFGTEGGAITPWFPTNGTWYNYFNEDYPTYVYSGQTTYYLAPGQWELFTSKPIEEDAIPAPSNLSASISGSSVNISWIDNASNETAYQIERSLSATTGFTTIAELAADSQVYNDNALSDGKYYYRVKAINANDESDYSNLAEAQIGSLIGFEVHFKNTSGWNDVNIYLFDYNADAGLNDWTWPGKDMTQEATSAWYSYTVNLDVQAGIIFNNNNGSQTDNLTRTYEGWYDFSTQQWYDECPGDCPTTPVPHLTVTPQSGTFSNAVLVSLLATEDGVITYTIDGSDPKTGSFYSEELEFTTTTRLRAIAENLEGYSEEIDETYTITKPVPTLSADPTGTTFTNSIDVTLLASEDGNITYTLDGSDPKTGDAYNTSITLTETTQLRAIAENQNGYSDEINETYTKVIAQCDTIFYFNNNNWSNVNIYLFNANGTGIDGWNWPGVQMNQKGTSNWYYYVNCEEGDVGIVFNNGFGDKEYDQYQNSGWFYKGNWYSSCPGDCSDNTSDGITIFYKNNTNWNTVNMYFWAVTPSAQTTSWPGVQMIDNDGDGWFEYTLEGAECASVIFSNSGIAQTGDLNICGNAYYDNGWVSTPEMFKSTTGETKLSSSNASDLAPYPNPFSNELTLTVKEQNTEVVINIVDLNGSIVYSKTINSNSGTITAKPIIPNGVYIMHITSPGNIYTHRIVKQ